jgi:hypothetical protein
MYYRALYSINVLGLVMYAGVIVLYKLWVYLYGVCFRTTHSAINSHKILCVVDNRAMPRKSTFDVPFSTRYSARRFRRLWQFLVMTAGITKRECQFAAHYLLRG